MLLPRRIEPAHVLGTLVVALSSLAWVALWIMERAPGGHALHHGFASVRDTPRLLPLFLAGWTVMVVAMMLPAQLPVFLTLHNRRAASPIRFGGLLIVGYLAVWTLCGVAVYMGDWLLQHAVATLPWLQRQAWAFGALSLIVAGSYQLTPAKRTLLDGLHTGHHDARQRHMPGTATGALKLGARHGLCCAGCCWSLMLLMFSAGSGTLGWMLALGTIMALEKTTAWGRRLVAPLGITLIICGVLVLFFASRMSGNAGHVH